MSDVPKFVRQRMAQQPAGDHPESNLLAAFAEGGLSRREREHVLTHLGVCAACRDVVALAAPEDMASMRNAAPAPRNWFRWPVVRWAGVAAAVVVVAGAVALYDWHKPEAPPVASYASREQKAPGAIAPSQAPSKPAAPQSLADAGSKLSDRLQEKKSLPTRQKEAGMRRDSTTKQEVSGDKKDVVAGAGRGGPVSSQANSIANSMTAATLPQTGARGYEYQYSQPQAQSQNSSNAAVQAQAQGSISNAGGLVNIDANRQQANAAPLPSPARSNENGEIARQASATEEQNAKGQNAQAELDQVNDARAASSSAAKSKPASEPAAVTTTEISRAGIAGGAMMKRAVNGRLQWRISSAGVLQRSLDGRIWEAVPIAAGGTAPKLRSFSAVGSEIWAGGSGGAVYHSSDAGRSWARLSVKDGDLAPDSDIVHIEFSDSERGALKTVSGQTWTTTDAGTTWSLKR